MSTQSSAKARLQDQQAAKRAVLICHAVILWDEMHYRYRKFEVFYFWKLKNNTWLLFFLS